MSDVLTELRSYREELEERAPEIMITEVTTPVAAPIGGRRGPWLVVAVSVAAVLIVGLLLVLNQNDGVPPVDSVVPTTMVDAIPTTVAPVAQSAETGAQPTVEDDEIVLAMAQSFPLRQYRGLPWTSGPDEALGQTAGIRTSGDVDGPDGGEPLGQFSVDFMAFETEGLASSYLDAQSELPEVLEIQPLAGLGDEASVMFLEGNWLRITAHGHALVRHGRFVSETVVILYGDSHSDLEASIAEAIVVAEITDETMQTVLASEIQPLRAPEPEALTSYEISVIAIAEAGGLDSGADAFSVVTPEGYGCVYGEAGNQGVAEIDGEVLQRIDWREGWFVATPDSPEFRNGKDLCQAWSPHLEESYLGDLIMLQDGHVGIDSGRLTKSYWFTKDDLIAAGVLTSSDDIDVTGFHMIVDQAGPWLVQLSFSAEGDPEAIEKVTRLDVPDLETASGPTWFSIDVDYGIIDDGSETWADRLEEMVQPRP